MIPIPPAARGSAAFVLLPLLAGAWLAAYLVAPVVAVWAAGTGLLVVLMVRAVRRELRIRRRAAQPMRPVEGGDR